MHITPNVALPMFILAFFLWSGARIVRFDSTITSKIIFLSVGDAVWPIIGSRGSGMPTCPFQSKLAKWAKDV